ncbi:hypothetical protein BS50DRAFT_672727 [Corynespora cassiicola Philippines]|uniref:Uncharacterized protein n=1 Tax=Corynespora cassiicola Philippines TaxID=1448308 RepID=A0A2T2P2R8_CORCC|nr:hypothetical protein BS50DRAFT_672727 [Corynespora cassiicola Philippines]
MTLFCLAWMPQLLGDSPAELAAIGSTPHQCWLRQNKRMDASISRAKQDIRDRKHDEDIQMAECGTWLDPRQGADARLCGKIHDTPNCLLLDEFRTLEVSFRARIAHTIINVASKDDSFLDDARFSIHAIGPNVHQYDTEMPDAVGTINVSGRRHEVAIPLRVFGVEADAHAASQGSASVRVDIAEFTDVSRRNPIIRAIPSPSSRSVDSTSRRRPVIVVADMFGEV